MYQELSKKLGYEFTDIAWLRLALTHRSYETENNERLEFVGDAIVNFVIGEALYQKFPKSHEGDLSRWRATLVNRETLGNIAREFNLGRYILLGTGELKSGGCHRVSILSCTMEAIIAAIYFDGGFEAARISVLSWYQALLNAMTLTTNTKDPKTRLQEYLQNLHQALPVYTVNSIQGHAHEQIFTVQCHVVGQMKDTIGRGTSRRRAEQEAAEMMLGQIKK